MKVYINTDFHYGPLIFTKTYDQPFLVPGGHRVAGQHRHAASRSLGKLLAVYCGGPEHGRAGSRPRRGIIQPTSCIIHYYWRLFEVYTNK